MQAQNRKYNLVYFLCQSSWQEELKYSLRSFERYFTALNEVWIVGHLPSYIDPSKIHHIPKQPMVNPGIFTHSGVRRLFVRDFPKIGEDFIVASDDHYLLRATTFEDFGPYFIQDLTQLPSRGSSEWQLKLWRTHDLLIHMGYPAFNFESHTPMQINRIKYTKMANLFLNIEKHAKMDNQSYCSATAYWNILNHGGKTYRKAADYGVGFLSTRKAKSTRNILSLLKDKTFLYHNDQGLTKALKTVIRELYPDKSRFEI